MASVIVEAMIGKRGLALMGGRKGARTEGSPSGYFAFFCFWCKRSMPVIDMSELKPVGEFGSREWGEACAEASIKMLEGNRPAGFN